jgi:hypothetical protein
MTSIKASMAVRFITFMAENPRLHDWHPYFPDASNNGLLACFATMSSERFTPATICAIFQLNRSGTNREPLSNRDLLCP